jgi:hypothetical protein
MAKWYVYLAQCASRFADICCSANGTAYSDTDQTGSGEELAACLRTPTDLDWRRRTGSLSLRRGVARHLWAPVASRWDGRSLDAHEFWKSIVFAIQTSR